MVCTCLEGWNEGYRRRRVAEGVGISQGGRRRRRREWRSPKAPTLPQVTQDSHTVQMRQSVDSHTTVSLQPPRPHTSVNVGDTDRVCVYVCVCRVCVRQCSSNPPHWTPAHTPSFIGNGGHISSTA